MRFLFVASLFCALCFTDLNAQAFVGGTLGFTSTGNSEADDSDFAYRVVPQAGFFISDAFVVGTGIGIIGTNSPEFGDSKSKTTGIVINPFARLRSELSGDLGFYGEVGFDVRLNSSKFVPSTGASTKGPKSTEFEVYLGPGIDYMLGDNFFINALWGALSYSTTKTEDVDARPTTFGLNLDMSNINFGLNYMF